MKLKKEPVAIGAVVIAALGVAVVLGLPKELAGSLITLVGAIGGVFVRSQVVPVSTTVTAVTDAATKAATATASQLTSTTVGAVGEVTDTALGVVEGVTNLATSTALRGIGIGRKDQQAG